MAKWLLYILECSDSSLYTGITTNIEKRIKRHNEGRACKYTRARRPVIIAYKETMENEDTARSKEAYIKALSRAKKLKLIKQNSPPAVLSHRSFGTKIARNFQGT